MIPFIIVTLFGLMIIGVPIAFSLGGASIVGISFDRYCNAGTCSENACWYC